MPSSRASPESPRLALRMDLPDRLDVEPHPEGISRYGAILRIPEQRASHGITRRPWPRPCEAAGEGFAVMSGISYGVASVQGNCSPDKEFRYLRTVRPIPLCRHEAGPYLHRLQESRVWRMASEDSGPLTRTGLSC